MQPLILPDAHDDDLTPDLSFRQHYHSSGICGPRISALDPRVADKSVDKIRDGAYREDLSELLRRPAHHE